MCVLAVCGHVPADVVFALDASSSIWGLDFKRQLKFVEDLVDNFQVSPTATRVGIATFGDHPKKEFDLDTYDNIFDIKASIAHIRQSRGNTNTAGVLHSLRKHFFEESGRDGVVKVAIVITDGESNDPKATAHQAQLAREAGIHIFAIGVGRNVILSELKAIASQPSEQYVFQVDSYVALQRLKVLLAKRACEGKTD